MCGYKRYLNSKLLTKARPRYHYILAFRGPCQKTEEISGKFDYQVVPLVGPFFISLKEFSRQAFRGLGYLCLGINTHTPYYNRS